MAFVVDRYHDSVKSLRDQSADSELPDDIQTRIDGFVDAGISLELATEVASLGPAYGFLDLSTVARRAEMEARDASEIHRLIEDHLDLSSLREWVTALPRDDHWQTMARGALRDQYFLERAELHSDGTVDG